MKKMRVREETLGDGVSPDEESCRDMGAVHGLCSPSSGLGF